MAESIAIVGIGAMGAGAAGRLLDQGQRVVVWNRTRSKTAPLLAFIGRLDPQKGVDLILEIMPGLLAAGAQFVSLGQGHWRPS